MKIGRAYWQFRESNDDTDEYLSGGAPAATHTYVTSGEVGKENPGIPLNAIPIWAGGFSRGRIPIDSSTSASYNAKVHLGAEC